MAQTTDPARNLLFGLLALQNGLIDQVQLVSAFQAWIRDKSRPLADYLVSQANLDPDDCVAVEALVVRHLKKHAGDPEKSLASVAVGRSTCDSLARVADADIQASLAQVRPTDQPDLDRTATFAIGTETSDGQRFRILRPHACGGLGAVFVALDEELHREVALKQLLEAQADVPESRQRFLLEAEITGGLEHPGIVPVYGLGTYSDGRPFYAMRFISGDSLKEAIQKSYRDQSLRADPGRRSLELRKLLRRFLDVCNAIEYAHSRGVLHRDIKPGNVIVGKHGETLVVDWGLAKAIGKAGPCTLEDEQPLRPSPASGDAETLPGSALGTPSYMSPEQAAGDLERLGPRSDVYSLGATLYCLLTGKPPFEGDDVGALLRAVREGDFPPPRQLDPRIDQTLEAICLKAMARTPEDRYGSPRALAEDIERWTADEPVSARRPSAIERLGRWTRHHRPLVAGAAGLLLATTVGLAFGLALMRRASDEIQHRQRQAERNYEMAREAVDRYFTTVSESRLLEEPQMDLLRQELLRAAREYYQRFAAERQGDPAAQVELARAHIRLSIMSPMHAAISEAEQARAIYGKLAEKAGAGPEVLRGLTETRRRLGQVYREAGRTRDAELELKAGADLCQGLIAHHPSVADYRYQLAAIQNDLAVLLRVSGRNEEAIPELRSAQKLLEALLAEGVDHRSDLHSSYRHLGKVAEAAGRRSEAREAHRRALDLGRSIVVDFPKGAGARDHLAWSLMDCGRLDAGDGRTTQAEAEITEALVILRKLVEEHSSAYWFWYGLGRAEIDRGRLVAAAGRAEEAEAGFKRACGILETWLARDPALPDVTSDLVESFINLGELYVSAGRMEQAGTTYERAIELYTKMRRSYPNYIENTVNLARAYTSLVRLKLRMGRREEAQGLLGRAVTALKPTSGTGDRGVDQALRAVYASRAGILGSMGRHADALADYERAIGLADGAARDQLRLLRACELARSGDYRRADEEAKAVAVKTDDRAASTAYNIACVEALAHASARGDGARPPADRTAVSEPFSASAMNWLEQARRAGMFRNPSMVSLIRSDPDLDSLRDRTDFKLFLMDLIFPDDPFQSGANPSR
jgi:serine/threonine-protein kinase